MGRASQKCKIIINNIDLCINFRAPARTAHEPSQCEAPTMNLSIVSFHACKQLKENVGSISNENTMKQRVPALALNLICLLISTSFVQASKGQVNTGKRYVTVVLDATQVEASAAITNLFKEPYYHGMLVIELSPIVSGYGLTNGWQAQTTVSELTNITKGKKTLPYFAIFHIAAEPLGTNQCKIAVRTLNSWVGEGKEVGIHGGWAGHAVDVAPVLKEETNLLLQIARELRWIREGRTNMASTNAPPRRAGAGPDGMYGEEKAAFEAAVKAYQDRNAKSAGTTNNAQSIPP
jgi:hypothetical protein